MRQRAGKRRANERLQRRNLRAWNSKPIEQLLVRGAQQAEEAPRGKDDMGKGSRPKGESSKLQIKGGGEDSCRVFSVRGNQQSGARGDLRRKAPMHLWGRGETQQDRTWNFGGPVLSPLEKWGKGKWGKKDADLA